MWYYNDIIFERPLGVEGKLADGWPDVKSQPSSMVIRNSRVRSAEPFFEYPAL